VAPLAISCLIAYDAAAYFKITDLPTIYNQFGGTSFFFVLFCFGVTGPCRRPPCRCASAPPSRKSPGNPKVIVYGSICRLYHLRLPVELRHPD
jgi:hypothetical protein